MTPEVEKSENNKLINLLLIMITKMVGLNFVYNETFVSNDLVSKTFLYICDSCHRSKLASEHCQCDSCKNQICQTIGEQTKSMICHHCKKNFAEAPVEFMSEEVTLSCKIQLIAMLNEESSIVLTKQFVEFLYYLAKEPGFNHHLKGLITNTIKDFITNLDFAKALVTNKNMINAYLMK